MAKIVLLYRQPFGSFNPLISQAPLRRPFTPRKKYRAKDYVHYANFDGIDVNRVENIPCNYRGIMGVPVSFLNHCNRCDFQIIGLGLTAFELPRPKYLHARVLVRYLRAGGRYTYPTTPAW